MNRKRRPLAAFVPMVLIAMVSSISACGSSAPPTTSSTSNGAGHPTTTAHEQAVKFAVCMRDNGVSAFPDPPASGGFTIDGVVNGSSLDPNSPTFEQAISACKALEPPGFTGQKATPQQLQARLKFAQCMRDNGVNDFPDPTPNGPLIDTTRIPSLAGKDPRSDPALNTAMRACRGASAAAGVVSR